MMERLGMRGEHDGGGCAVKREVEDPLMGPSTWNWC